MITAVKKIFEPLFQLIYPHTCSGCGNDLMNTDHILCPECLDELPNTDFASLPENPIERMFHGRLNVYSAMSQLYFSKGTIVQNLIHELKYKGRKDVGISLGRMMGKSLLSSERFRNIDLMIPVPLTKFRARQRGYNQAEVLCLGINEVFDIPIIKNVLIRTRSSSTQTRKKRIERWRNVESNFSVVNPELVEYKHILLVDDVITTGATLDAGGLLLLNIPGVRLSLASVAWATK